MKKPKPSPPAGITNPESLMMSYAYNPEWSEGALKCPIFQTSTFVFKNAEEGKAFFEIAYGLRKQGRHENLGLIYSRLNNPDLEILENRLSLWDGAESCTVFESGMAAIATTLMTYLKPGDTILHSDPLYGGTDYFIKHILTGLNIQVIGFNAGATKKEILQLVKKSNGKGKIKMLYIETPANPTNVMVDIGMCAEIAEQMSTSNNKVKLAVDNTFLGPLWQHPLKHGADLVIYSATKFIGGHSDVIAGACLGKKEDIQLVRAVRTFFGTMAGPWTGWLLMRSLETLKLRMTCQMKNAVQIADFLASHPKVEKVYFPGTIDPQDPQYEIYKKQCFSPGSMISFDLRGGEKEAFQFLNHLKLIKLAVSLGGTESLAEHPATMTHSDIDKKTQKKFGITDKMIRLSVGVENPNDIMDDLKTALGTIQ
ncbi:MAG: methionine gamma-lyase [Bacteroidetes bacterium RIFCSPLOWO2_02_FULL_36_8]|nr:MAG: methionine gamma-lyase [Bacteroidetes bacterium RIFCSPLOWO2_02_FULL_36_8]OFY68886.1 MAG: methionine gamma-lyase [Bacteroidetes bacterium RIFCSPLOWO2_12_FULL_37_12]